MHYMQALGNYARKYSNMRRLLDMFVCVECCTSKCQQWQTCQTPTAKCQKCQTM